MATKRLLELAIKGLEAERDRIDQELANLKSRMNGDTASPAGGGGFPGPFKTAKKVRGLTAAGRKKLSDMMKARWAARRKAAAKASK